MQNADSFQRFSLDVRSGSMGWIEMKKKSKKIKKIICWTFDLGHLKGLKFILFYVAALCKPAISQSPTAYVKCNFRVLHNFCYML